jgi:hypothetical protein
MACMIESYRLEAIIRGLVETLDRRNIVPLNELEESIRVWDQKYAHAEAEFWAQRKARPWWKKIIT